MLLYHLRHAFRRLVREPAFTTAAVLTLALGVGANVAVFAVVEAVLLRPLPYPEADRLAIVDHRDQRTGITKNFIAIGDFVDLNERQNAFEAFGAYDSGPATIVGESESYLVSGMSATPGALDALRLRPAIGRSFLPEEGRPGGAQVIILGHDLWRTRFGGDSGIVGRSIKLGQQDRLVVGIAPPGFSFPPNATTDVITPMQPPVQAPSERKSGWTFVVARLKAGTSLPDASANLAAISHQLETEYPQSNQASGYFAVPLRDALVGGTKPALLLLLAAVVVVLLIACANVADLLMVRSMARSREMAVRIALGAGRARLAAQLVTESLVLSLVAAVAGIAMAHWGARALVALVPQSAAVPGLADVRINGAVLGFALAVAIVTALVFTLVSVLAVRAENAAAVLVSGVRASMGTVARRVTAGLVAAEVALAIVLLIGAGLILGSFSRLLAVDPGFRYDRVMTLGISVPAARYRDDGARAAFYDRAFAELRSVPDVREVGAAAVTPLTGNNWTSPFERPEHPVPPGERPPEVGWQEASAGYFRALQVPLVAGRLFDERERPGGPPVVIISEALQRKYFPEGSAVGRQVSQGGGRPAEIIGVVGSIRRSALSDEPRADMYFPFESSVPNATTLFVRTSGDPARALEGLKLALRRVEPATVFRSTRTLADIASQSVSVTSLVLRLLVVFAGIALSLAAVGIYGVMSFVVRQRTREIGTRIALGATRRDILMLVMREGGMIAAAGIVAGLGAGLVAARSLRSILYGISSSDPATLALATGVLAATTLVACYVPARRAASVDPARSLSEH